MHLSIIIPAYNEERNIVGTIRDIYQYLRARNLEHEIIVVENGSKDQTAEKVRSLMTEISSLKLIQRPANGKGFAVKAGMMEAVGDFRLFTDADNSTSINHIERMMPFFNQGYDVVIGSIALAGHKIAAGSEPLWRRVAGKMGNLFIQILVLPGIYDTQRGFKIFTASAVKDIFPRITIGRWGFDIEALALAKKYGYKIKEVPIDWKNDPNSHVGAKAYIQVLWETVKIRLNLWTGKYD
jgi:glycosyltransferase involved in cell wall biosynthesis